MSTPGPDDPTLPLNRPKVSAGDSDATIPVAAPRPSMPNASVPDLPLPEELSAMLPAGAYLVDSFIGQGGMGAVYKGTQVRLKRPVAIKIMRRDLGRDFDFEARFEREAQAMAKLNHPNIVSVIDYGEAGADYLYIVMEFVDGADLMEVIRTGQMTQEMALSLLPQVCDALQFAHDHGVVHRDIKPSNIILTRDGKIKMADFGLAKRYDVDSSFRTQTGTGMGTPDYAAPEQFDPHAHVDHRADIYALGVMIYQMITGALPRGVWKPPSQRVQVDPLWDQIVSRAMQNDPNERYQHASDVKTDVSSLMSGKRTPAIQPRANPTTNVSRMPWVIGGLVGMLMAVGAMVVFNRPPPPGAPDRTERAGMERPPLPPPQHDRRGPPPGPERLEMDGQRLWDSASNVPQDVPGSSWENGALHLKNTAIKHARPPSRDLVLRVSVRCDDNPRVPSIRIRDQGPVRGDQDSYYKLTITKANDGNGVIAFGVGKATEPLKTWPFPHPLRADEWLPLELRAEGSRFTITADGQRLGEVEDHTLDQAGGISLFAGDAYFRDILYLPLDGGPRHDPDRGLPLWSNANSISPGSGAAWGGDHVRVGLLTHNAKLKNGVLRASVSLNADAEDPQLRVRQARLAAPGQTDNTTGYSFGPSVKDKTFELMVREQGRPRMLKSWPFPKPYSPDAWVKLELRFVDDQLTASVDGQVLGTVTDSTIASEGHISIQAKANGLFRDIELVTLDAPP